MIYLSVKFLPKATSLQSTHWFVPLHTSHRSFLAAPPHTALQSVLQSFFELASHLPHLQQEKEKSWCGLVISKETKSRGAGS